MLVFALVLLFFANHQPVSVIFDFAGTEQATNGNFLAAFMLGLFMSIFILYGFDTAGTFGEETSTRAGRRRAASCRRWSSPASSASSSSWP